MALPFKHGQLVEASVLQLLLSDVLPNGGLVSSYGGYVVASRPKVLAREVLPPPEVAARNVNGALPLDEPDDLRDRMKKVPDSMPWILWNSPVEVRPRERAARPGSSREV